MGKLLNLFGVGTTRPPAGPPIELHPQAIVDADACHRSGADVGSCTAGLGAVTEMIVAGTPMRQDALGFVVTRPRQPGPNGYLPAVLMREPDNAKDKDAIRVLVDGVLIGYLFADKAKEWQPVLREVERRGQLLVGALRVYGGGSETWGAAVQVRDNLPGFDGPITKAKQVRQKTMKDAQQIRAIAPKELIGTEWQEVGRQLLRLAQQDSVRTKQQAGLAVKKFRALLPELWGHANARRSQPFTDLLEAAEGAADDLLTEPEDADDREDFHAAFTDAVQELTDELRKHG